MDNSSDHEISDVNSFIVHQCDKTIEYYDPKTLDIIYSEPVPDLFRYNPSYYSQCKNCQVSGTDFYVLGDGIGKMYLMNTKTKFSQMLPKGSHENHLFCIDSSKDSRFLVSGDEGCKICFWNLDKKECVFTYEDHSQGVLAVVFIKKPLFASGSWDDKMKIFDYEKSVCITTMSEHEFQVNDVKYDEELQLIFTASNDEKIKMFDMRVNKVVNSVFNGKGDSVFSLLYLKRTNCLIFGDSTGNVGCVDLRKTQKFVYRKKEHDKHVMVIKNNDANIKNTFMTGSDDKFIKIMKNENGQAVKNKHFPTHKTQGFFVFDRRNSKLSELEKSDLNERVSFILFENDGDLGEESFQVKIHNSSTFEFPKVFSFL